jgi:hypothetical protein
MSGKDEYMTTFEYSWDTTLEQEWSVPLESVHERAQALSIPIHASTASMQVIELTLHDDHHDSGYKALFTVEWSGDHSLVIPVTWLESFGQPKHPGMAVRLTLAVKDNGPLRAVLTMGLPAWTEQIPLIAVNERESLLEICTAPGFWDTSLWAATAGSGSLDKFYLYGQLSAICGLALPGMVAYTKQFDIRIDEFQALIAGVSTDSLGAFSLTVCVDGHSYRAIDRKPGSGFEELRVPLKGSILNSVTIELEAVTAWRSGEAEKKLLSFIYWLMLEKHGADPALGTEVYGSAEIADPIEAAAPVNAASAGAIIEEIPAEILPVGFLFNQEELQKIRQRVRHGESQRIFGEIRAEAEANLSYRPENYFGTYVPVDWAKQGIERAATPNTESQHMFSTLVYSAFVYAVTGEERFGLMARRTLLTVARTKHWAAGFVARIPVGLRGYRATFIESHTSQAAALCYDMIYPLLSAAERREVEDALYEKGMLWLDAFLRQNGEGYLMGSNQGAVYVVGLLYAAIAAKRSHPDAEAVAERWSTWLSKMVPSYYKSDGSTNEGMMYWEYTTHHLIEALLIISKHSGQSIQELITPSLAQTMDYVAHMRSLSSETLRFLALGDCREEDFKYMGPIFLFFARHLGDSRGQWLWNQYYSGEHPPGSPFFGVPLGTGQYTTNGLLTLLLLQEKEPTVPSLPPHRLFEETERLFWRTGADYGSLLFFFEGGKQSFEHTHYDKGQFMLEAYGEGLAVDPGTIEYSRPFASYLKSTRFHNVITVNGKNQSYKDPDQAVMIRSLHADKRYSCLRADLSNSYKELSVYNRTILFVRPDYLLVLDEVESLEAGLEWNLHSKGSYRKAGEGDTAVTMHKAAAQALHRQDNESEAAAAKSDVLVFQAETQRAGMHIGVISDHALTPEFASYTNEDKVLSHHLALRTDRGCMNLKLAAVLLPYPLDPTKGRIQTEIQAHRSSSGAVFTVSGSFGIDRIVCSFDDMRVLVERGDNSIIKV